jgi:hypothetical protein
MTAIRPAQDPAADELLSRDPFALLVGMLLDQQVAMEKPFAGPRLIADRLGTEGLDPALIASADPEEFAAIMIGPPAVHRYPQSMVPGSARRRPRSSWRCSASSEGFAQTAGGRPQETTGWPGSGRWPTSSMTNP